MLESIEADEADCSYCILASAHNGTGFPCCIFEGKHPDKAISIMQKWSDEHPQKTYKDDFFESFQMHLEIANALRNSKGYPYIYVCNLYKISNVCNTLPCSQRDCTVCWDKVMEE